MVNPSLQAEEFKRRYNIFTPLIVKKPLSKTNRKKAKAREKRIQKALKERAESQRKQRKQGRRQSGFSPRTYSDAFDGSMPNGIRSRGFLD